MARNIRMLDENTATKKYLCKYWEWFPSSEEEALDNQVFDGATSCKLASQIKSALVSASRKWVCDTKIADKLVRSFNKNHKQFNRRQCFFEG